MNRTGEGWVEEIERLKKRLAELEKSYDELKLQQKLIKRFETVVRDSNDAIIIHDLDGWITAWNRGAEQIYGYSEKEALAMNIERLTPPDKLAEHQEFTRRLIAGETVAAFETQRVTKKGDLLDIWLTLTKVEETPSDSIISTGRDASKSIGIALIERNISERKKAEEGLRKSEERYRELVQNANSAIIRWKSDGTIAFCNDYALKFFGYSEDEVIGKDVSMIVPSTESSGRNLSAMIRDIVEHPECYINNMNENVCRDGRRVWFMWTNRAILNDKHQVEEILAVGSDITERRKVEELLRQEQKQLYDLFDNMSSGVAIYKALDEGEDFIFTGINKAGERFSNIRREEVIGKRVMQVFPGIKEMGLFDVIRQVWKTGVAQRHPLTLYRDERIAQWVENYIYKLPTGEIVALYDDTTERKRMDDALGASEKRYRTLFEQSKDAIFVAEIDSRMLVDCNSKAVEMTGYSKEEVLSMRADELHPVDVADETMGTFQRQAAGEDVLAESVVLTKSGQRIFVSINTGIVELQGKAYLMGVFRDITDRRRADESLRMSEEKYRSIVDNIGIGVALISPDMKILSLNNQMKRWFPQVSPEEEPICYRAFNNPPRDGICSYCPTAKTLQDGLVHEDMTETPVGEQVFNYRVVSSPVKDETGKIIAAIEMVEDITERRRMEEEMRKHLRELEVFYKASIGREDRILELKKETERLKEELRQK